jgi:hypothetical protein
MRWRHGVAWLTSHVVGVVRQARGAAFGRYVSGGAVHVNFHVTKAAVAFAGRALGKEDE